MFQRRNPRNRWKRAREILWPSMGLSRVFRYYRHRVGRLPGTPYFIAAGFAAGVAVSFTPFVGFHMVTAGLIAWLMEGSLMAMVIGSVVAGNPWTFPLIWVGTYELGKIMLGQHGSDRVSNALSHGFTFADMMAKPMTVLLPMTLGCLPFVVISWFVSFYFVRQLVTGYKEARLARIYKHKRGH